MNMHMSNEQSMVLLRAELLLCDSPPDPKTFKTIQDLIDLLKKKNDDLDFAIHRLNDMLESDDAQAWKEAQKYVDHLTGKKTGF